MRPSVCFVSLNCYSVLSGDPSVRHIGGAEVQQSLLAHELVRRGYRVSFVVLDHGQQDGIEIDGIRLFKAYRLDGGVRYLRFFYPRLAKLWAAMARVDADIYYQRGADAETGFVANWCQRNRRRFLFAAAHDTNCDPALPLLHRRSERYLYRYGLKRTSAIISQTQNQVNQFQVAFGLRSILVRSCIPDIHDAARAGGRPPSNARPRLLWIGRCSKEKRLGMLFDLAKACPEYRFDVVGPSETDLAASRLLDSAVSLPNVTLCGWVPHDQIARVYDRVNLLICTSACEGYPNTFMEAWVRAIPVVSAVDPDSVISIHSLGGVADTVEGLKTAIDTLFGCPSHWQECASRARRFFLKNHRVDAAVDRLECVIRGVLDNR